MNGRNRPNCEVCAVAAIEKESFVSHMLHIILLILKIIGIVLLSILGIIILAILGVLFVPVRYRIRVTRVEGEGQPPVTAYVKVTWLLHIVNILVRYPAEVIVRARVLIFTLFRIPEKEKKEKKKKRAKKEKKIKEKKEKKKNREEENVKPEETDENIDNQEFDPETMILETQDVQVLPEERETSTVSTVTEPYVAFMGDEEIESEPEESEEKKSLFDKIEKILSKIKQIIEKIKALLENIQYTIRKFCDKIKAVLDNIQYYREVLESDPFRQSLQMCKGELGWVLKRLKPDKFEADLIVGMENPATTGEILAICGMLYPLIGQHVRISGDFECEKTRVEGRLYIRGRIRMFTFLRIVIRLYFNKDIKKLIKLLKKEAV